LNSRHNAVVSPAPFLHKERVVLTGFKALAGGPNGGGFYALVNGNGFADSSTTAVVPQEALWN